jgi:hypothetical protein
VAEHSAAIHDAFIITSDDRIAACRPARDGQRKAAGRSSPGARQASTPSQWLSGGASAADYSGTAGIQEINFFDANGSSIAGERLTFADGSPFLVGRPGAEVPGVPGVPVPPTLILLVAGAGALLFRRGTKLPRE